MAEILEARDSTRATLTIVCARIFNKYTPAIRHGSALTIRTIFFTVHYKVRITPRPNSDKKVKKAVGCKSDPTKSTSG